jgi:hypothetical protein
VSDDDGRTKWVGMVKTTKSNHEKTTLVVGEHKFNELINLNLFWFFFLTVHASHPKWVHWPAK